MEDNSEILSYVKSIDEKLNLMNRLLAYGVCKEMGVLAAAPLLRRLGLLPTEIATICGSTPNTISVAIAKARKQKPKK